MVQVREQATAQRTGRAAVRESVQNDTVISDLDIRQDRQAEGETKQDKQINGSRKLADANAKGSLADAPHGS